MYIHLLFGYLLFWWVYKFLTLAKLASLPINMIFFYKSSSLLTYLGLFFMVLVLYGLKWLSLTYFRALIVMMLPLRCYLVIKAVLFIVCFSWLGCLISHESCGLSILKLDLICIHQCLCIKVDAFYLFKAPYLYGLWLLGS